MLENFRKKIEQNRNSGKIAWKLIAGAKDFLWNLYVYCDCAEINCRRAAAEFFPLSRRGKLPDFLIVGAQKSGTTYLWKMLNEHLLIEMSPNFCEIKDEMANKKEINFFTDGKKFSKGVSWYKSLFNDNGKIQGEANTDYCFRKDIHRKMFQIIPEAKLIMILRNPVDRAYSAFNHMRQDGRGWGKCAPDKSFSENIDIDIESNLTGESIISRGFYAEQIKSLLKYYSPDQLLILIAEQMKENPEKIYRKICQFIGAPFAKINLNKKIHARNYDGPINKIAEEKLREIYSPRDEELYELLGYKIKEWEKQ